MLNKTPLAITFLGYSMTNLVDESTVTWLYILKRNKQFDFLQYKTTSVAILFNEHFQQQTH
jgi:hypothetical protein